MSGPIITCPVCGHKRKLADLLHDQVSLRWSYLIGRFGPRNLALVDAWLDCFAKPGGVVRVATQTRYLEQLWEVIDAGELTYKRRTVPVDLQLVLHAMTETQRTKQGAALTNLNYTWSILLSAADQADAASERQREEALKAGHREAAPAARTAGQPERVDPETAKKFIDQALGRIGKGGSR